MNKLNIIENENGKEAVLCSQLFKELGLQTTNYKRWVSKNITNNPFAIEGTDFAPLSYQNDVISNNKTVLTYPKDNLTKKSKRDFYFVLSLDFAKHLAMLCRTEKGREIRKYFLVCEQLAKSKETDTIQALKKELSTYRRLEQIRLLRLQLNREVKELKKDILNKTDTAITDFKTQLILNFN